MIPGSVGTAVRNGAEQRAATVAKESPKIRSGTLTSTFEGNNQNTLTSSAVFASAAFSADADTGRFPNSAGNSITLQKSIASMVSFNSSSDEGPDASRPDDALGNKVDVVYSLLTMLSSHDRLQSSQMLLSISQERETCQLIRRSGCMGLLIQLLHPGDIVPLPPPTGDELEVIRRASEALKNIVRYDDDEARQRRDSVVLLLLEHVRNYVLHLRLVLAGSATYQTDFCEQAYAAMATLTKLSYEEENRRSTCVLGGLHCIAEALILDQKIFTENCPPMNLDFRRFIGMTLTNLTYGASETKRTLCSGNQFLQALNAQIASQPEELRQVYAGVLRNLSWKTDASSKLALRQAGTVATLMQAAMDSQKETTLKSLLSALWNLSAHCSENKAKICAVSSALQFLVSTLSYKSPSRSMAVIESGGGILRNISSHISLKDEYREILRQNNCFQILLDHLQSPSLTIVSNACGTLWNLSAHSVIDQRTLWQMGAEKKLRDLVHSKHKMISLGSSATLKNLLASRPNVNESGTSAFIAPQTEKKNHGFVKLRQHKSSAEKDADENQLVFLSAQHDLSFSRSIAADQSSEQPLARSVSSPLRRQTPALEIAAMLNDVTRPVVLKPTASSPFRIPATPPSKNNERMSTSHVINELAGSADLNRSHRMHSSTISASFSLPSSKEEQVQIDKAAVHRFHNSLRKSSQPNSRMDGATDDRTLGYSTVTYGDTAIQMQQQPYGAYCDTGASRFAAIGGGTPMKNAPFPINPYVGFSGKNGSPEKPRVSQDAGPSSRMDGAPTQQRTAVRKPSVPGTPAEFKSEPSSRGSKSVTALTPLMFSRQSSMESLDSCDLHSVRSTVYSEYSQLPTGLPSPSELPDSPTNTLPPLMTAERKALIASHQQQCGFVAEERRGSEPASMVDGSSAAAQVTSTAGFPSSSDMVPCQPKKHDSEEKLRVFGNVAEGDEERPKIFGRERDDDEKPKVYGRMTDRPQGEFESNKLSASSSLSALTIDSDIKPKPLKLPAGQNNQLGFPSGEKVFVFTNEQRQLVPFEDGAQKVDICQELQDCILAARPSPKSNDNSVHPFPKPLNANRAIQPLRPPKQLPIGKAEAGVGEDEADLRHVMQSAMPKPKPIRSKANNNIRLSSPSRKGSHKVSVVKPFQVSPAATFGHRCSTEMARPTSIPSPINQRKNRSGDNASATSVHAKSTDTPRPENVMEKSEELLECIAMALPKPKAARKSKSLDRKVQRRDLAIAFTNSAETSQERVADVATTSDRLVVQDDSKALLLLSCSSALMSSAATAERIKDAAILVDSSNSAGVRTPPVARIAPKPHCGNASNLSQPTSSPRSSKLGSEKNEGKLAAAASSSKLERVETETNDDSLSEDNYSQLNDESFNLAPEDLDVDSMKDDEWLLAAANENAGCAEVAFFGNDQMPSPTELLIDCETFSAMSKQRASQDPGGNQGRPKILRTPPPTNEMKMVKGGCRVLQGSLASTLAVPKLAVRTTKATELRAKKTLQQAPGTKNEQNGLRAPSSGNARSRSMSPALNTGSLPVTPPRRVVQNVVGNASPPSRLRHCSSSSGRQEGQRPLTVANDHSSKAEANSAHRSPCGNIKVKRELGSNVRRTIESLQKRESASEDDSTSSPLTNRKKNIGPRSATKRQGGSSDSGSHSVKGADGKRALVTTV